MFLVLFLAFFAHASMREPGESPGPRSLCRRAEMNACIQDHAAARDAELRSLQDIDDKLQMIAKDHATISHAAGALESEARSARKTGEMAERERRSTEKMISSEPLFPAGPRPEEFFFPDEAANSWGELHPEKRRTRLIGLSLSASEKLAELEPRQRNLTMEIEALGASRAALISEQAQRAHQVNLHAGMCAEGCKMQFCRED